MGVGVQVRVFVYVRKDTRELDVKHRYANQNVITVGNVYHLVSVLVLLDSKEICVKVQYVNPNVEMVVAVSNQGTVPVHTVIYHLCADLFVRCLVVMAGDVFAQTNVNVQGVIPAGIVG